MGVQWVLVAALIGLLFWATKSKTPQKPRIWDARNNAEFLDQYAVIETIRRAHVRDQEREERAQAKAARSWREIFNGIRRAVGALPLTK